MPSKTIAQTVNTVDRDDASIRFYLSDDAAEHPRCLRAAVTLRDGEVQDVALQHVTRDQAGAVTGRVPAPPFTGAQMTALRGALRAIFDTAAAAAGYA